MNGLDLKDLAYAMARVAHENQSRKGTGEPYLRHVERVADGVNGWKAKAVAYLHDLVEDTPVTFDTLDIFFPRQIVDAVWLLTRKEDETYKEFVQRTVNGDTNLVDGAHALALEVKLADVRDNLRDINDVPDGGPSLERRYTWALDQLLGAIGVMPEGWME